MLKNNNPFYGRLPRVGLHGPMKLLHRVMYKQWKTPSLADAVMSLIADEKYVLHAVQGGTFNQSISLTQQQAAWMVSENASFKRPF